MTPQTPPQPAQPDVSTQPDLDWVVADEHGENGKILVHNDDVTPYDFVIVILRSIFGLNPSDSERVTAYAHFNGVAYVMTLPIEEAKHRVGRAHAVARQAGYPLKFTIEPERST